MSSPTDTPLLPRLGLVDWLVMAGLPVYAFWTRQRVRAMPSPGGVPT